MTFNPMSLEERTILVTGATSGIGKATAVYLSKLGARIIASGRNEERLNEVLGQLQGEGHLGRIFDLAQLDGIVPWLKGLCAEIGPLNGIAHCAGVQATRPIQAVNPAFITNVLTQNLGASLMLAQAFRLKACHGTPASLVYVSSSAALKTAPGNVVYASSKGGIVSAVKGLGVELVRDGVRVNAVAPAMVDTPMSDQFRTILSEDNFKRVVDMHPLGLGHPDDVAAAIAFLLADTSRWITGSILSVDGGFLA
ncbi:MAG TPA: SDR family oxidoreductase [Asticcacaulis sp.]|nr:SDR family oxidoreductase [Asticcacaulis sp.]